jgi:hypothetical protein
VSDDGRVVITLPADVQQIDQTGHAWAFLDEAAARDRVVEGAVIVAGDRQEPFLARVVDVVTDANGRAIVHLDVVGVPGPAIDDRRTPRS